MVRIERIQDAEMTSSSVHKKNRCSRTSLVLFFRCCFFLNIQKSRSCVFKSQMMKTTFSLGYTELHKAVRSQGRRSTCGGKKVYLYCVITSLWRGTSLFSFMSPQCTLQKSATTSQDNKVCMLQHLQFSLINTGDCLALNYACAVSSCSSVPTLQ